MHCMSTKFGVDSSSLLPFRVPTHRQTQQVINPTDHSTHRSASAKTGNYYHHYHYCST